MVEDKKIGTTNEESNIDQINKLVTGSVDTETNDEKPEAVDYHEEKELEEEHHKVHHKVIETKPVTHIKHEKKIEKVEHKAEIKKEHKVEIKPVHKTVNHTNTKKHNHVKIETKKPEIKKTESKIKVDKSVSKKEVKNVSQTKKAFSIKKPSKEEKMAESKLSKKNKKDNKKKFKFTKSTLLWIGIGILAAILVIAATLILTSKKTTPTPGNETIKGVAATVNGEAIYLQDVLKEYNSINPLVKSQYSVESVLNKSIDEMLLYQEAKNQGMKVTSVEIESELELIKVQNQLTDIQLEKALTDQGLTLEAAKVMIEKNLMVRKLLNATILQDIKITENQIEKYYLQNLNEFEVPAKVTVQHILIMSGQNVTEDESKTKIEQIQKELTPTNFCDLVTKYTEDISSVGNCGKYTFAKGDFNNPDFENPSFDMKVGENAIVKTIFGYHLIKKLEAIPATTLSLSEVSNEINMTLTNDAAQLKFDALKADLMSKAVIVNYMTKQESSTDSDTTKVSSLDAFAKCITEKGAVFYGASWCSHCNNQKKDFGDSMQYIKYVECAVEGQPQVQTSECTKAGISGYPTWIINGKSYPGEQPFDKLAKLTGCTLSE